jgi:hypothetical protein
MDNPWLDIRNTAGHLLFRYNPWTNEIEFKGKGCAYDIIKLDEVRMQLGIIEQEEPNSMLILTIQERRNGSTK